MGSSQTRARTRVPCTGRWILNHCACGLFFFFFFLWSLFNSIHGASSQTFQSPPGSVCKKLPLSPTPTANPELDAVQASMSSDQTDLGQMGLCHSPAVCSQKTYLTSLSRILPTHVKEDGFNEILHLKHLAWYSNKASTQ